MIGKIGQAREKMLYTKKGGVRLIVLASFVFVFAYKSVCCGLFCLGVAVGQVLVFLWVGGFQWGHGWKGCFGSLVWCCAEIGVRCPCRFYVRKAQVSFGRNNEGRTFEVHCRKLIRERRFRSILFVIASLSCRCQPAVICLALKEPWFLIYGTSVISCVRT